MRITPQRARELTPFRIHGVPACYECMSPIFQTDEAAPDWAEDGAVCSGCGRRLMLPTTLAVELRQPVPYFVDRHGGAVKQFAPRHQRTREPLYLTGCTNPLTRDAAKIQPRLGMLAQPGNALHRQGGDYAHWAIDNGVFGVAKGTATTPGRKWSEEDTERYLAYLERLVREVDTSNVLFATAPDVLQFSGGIPMGHAQHTWYQSGPIFERIRELGLPVALVLQDGVLDADPMHHKHWDLFDAVFIGGSDHFKLGQEAEWFISDARAHGKWVHMGRVSSMKRMKRAQEMGVDSCDGTYIGFGPSKNLPQVLNWLDATSTTQLDTVALAA